MNLFLANLDHAKLHNVLLSDANLVGLADTVLIDAFLNGAHLQRANLTDVDLTGSPRRTCPASVWPTRS